MCYIDNIKPVIDKLVPALKSQLEAIIGEEVNILFKEGGQLVGINSFEIEIKTLSNKYVSFSKLCQLPGCCGVCVSFNSRVIASFNNKGIGSILNKFRIDLTRELGYGLLLCTDVSSNIKQAKILAKNNWKEIFEFKNPRTGNKVKIHVYNLTGDN